MVGSTRFVLAFVVFVCSMFVVITGEVCTPCPSGTHESWIRGRCLYVNEIQGKEAAWRTDRHVAHTTCEELGIRGYDWKLPAFQFIGKHETLFQILRERAGNGSIDFEDKMKKWRFWIRLVRVWPTNDEEEPFDDGEPMNKTSKWTWSGLNLSPTLADDLAYGAREFPPWAEDEPSEEFRPGKTRDVKTCVISKINPDGKYPWFEWIAAPCKFKTEFGKTADNLRKAMATSGILICEGYPKVPLPTVVGTSTIPCMKETTTSGNATDGPPATTPPSRPMYFNPVCGVFIALFVASLGFGITCSVCFFIQRRDIQKLEASAEKNKYVSTTSSDIPSMSTLVRIDSRPYTEDDHSRRMRLLALRAGKKKKRKTKKTKDQSEMS